MLCKDPLASVKVELGQDCGRFPYLCVPPPKLPCVGAVWLQQVLPEEVGCLRRLLLCWPSRVLSMLEETAVIVLHTGASWLRLAHSIKTFSLVT